MEINSPSGYEETSFKQTPTIQLTGPDNFPCDVLITSIDIPSSDEVVSSWDDTHIENTEVQRKQTMLTSEETLPTLINLEEAFAERMKKVEYVCLQYIPFENQPFIHQRITTANRRK